VSNQSLASTNIDQEKELPCLILWLDATAQAIGVLLSGFGPARAWIDKHRNELERGLLKKEWDDRVAELDNERKEIISNTAKALDYAGRVAGIVPTDHPKDAIDLLVEVKRRAESFSYPGLLGWELLDNPKLILENEMADAEERLEHMADVLRVLPVTPKDAEYLANQTNDTLVDEFFNTASQYADAVDRGDVRIVNRDYDSVLSGIKSLYKSLNPDDPCLAELSDMQDMAHSMKSFVNSNANRIENAIRYIPANSTCPGFDPHTIVNFRVRIVRIRKFTSNPQMLSEAAPRRVIMEALGYTDSRKFADDYEDKLDVKSRSRIKVKLNLITPAIAKIITTAISTWAGSEKNKK